MNLNKILLAVLVLVFFAFGQQSFISSSEFWPMYASKNYIFFNTHWVSLFMKPIFNLVLFLIHLIPLTDTQHVQFVKSIFAANGAAQLILLYLIFDRLAIHSKKWLIPLCLLIFLTPYYLTQFFSIRSDQLALTFFLLFLYLNIAYYQFKSAWNIFFVIFFPLIAFKQIYFSLLALSLLDYKSTFSFVVKSTKSEKLYISLLILGVIVWTANLALGSFNYFIASYQSFSFTVFDLIQFAKFEFFMILASLGCFLFKDFRGFLKKNRLNKFIYLQLIVLFLLIIHPQKFNYFIASFSPILFLPAAFFVIYLFENKKQLASYFVALTFLFQSNSLYQASKQIPLITSDAEQLLAIKKISSVLEKYKLTYLDGSGILPRQRNTGCFASLDDTGSNQSCLQMVLENQPDAILHSSRLLNIGINAELITKAGYQLIGPNFYVKSHLVESLKNEDFDWPTPMLVFGSFVKSI